MKHRNAFLSALIRRACYAQAKKRETVAMKLMAEELILHGLKNFSL